MSEMTIQGRWFLGIVIGSAFAFSGNSAIAQISSDGTLPNNSNVTINGSTFNINGGTQFGQNLFHSFQQFSLLTGDTAFFNNAADIQNIFGRVTGGSVSNIDGLIRANGIANLFLINPSGIIFGPNASLNVGGSFVGTTANAIQFGTQGFFSATNPEAPSPLLTINPSALVFNQLAAPIQNNSTQSAGVDPAGFNAFGLRVPNGKTLLLVGGNVNMDGGQLNAYGGRVELSGLATPGTVGLNVDGDKLSLDVPASSTRADISLTNGAAVYVEAAGGGNIAVNARNLELSGGSQLSAGIGQGLGSVGSQAGDITLNATGQIKVVSSYVYNNLPSRAVGNGGNLTISTQELLVQDGAFVGSNTFGAGNGGNLTIKTQELLAQDGSQVSANTYGAGNGGNLTVNASKKVEVIGSSADGQSPSGLFSIQNRKGATGMAGDLTINTPVLYVKNGAFVGSNTLGAGNGGNLTVNASDSVEVTGTTANGQNGSNLTTDTQGTGKAGNLTINTRRLVVNDSQVTASTSGKGDAGILTVKASESIDLNGLIFGQTDDYPAGLFVQVNSEGEGRGGKLNIETGRLSISNGAKVQVATFGQGDAGDLFLRAKDIDIFETPQPKYTYYPTGIFAGVRTTRDAQKLPLGNGGSARIETNRLTVRDGGVVTSNTQGQGNAGSLQIRATEFVEVFGTAPGAQFRGFNEPKNSEISAAVTPESIGNGGSLSIVTGRLIVRDSGTVTVRNEGKGRTNQAGKLEINARSINLNQGSLTATTNSGNGGDIILNAKDLLLLRNNSTISATAGTAGAGGNGGNITINTPFGFIVTVPNENSDITANAFSGSGGRVAINATGIFGIAPLSRQDLERLRPSDLDPRQLPTDDITAISQQNPNLSGQINVNTPEVDPSRGLVQLPTVVVDTPGIVVSSCAAFADEKGSQFTIAGRGGLPPTPDEPLTNDVVWTDTRVLAITSHQTTEKPTPKAEPVAMLPATGWVFNGKGEVTLISSAPRNYSWGTTPTGCLSQS